MFINRLNLTYKVKSQDLKVLRSFYITTVLGTGRTEEIGLQMALKSCH